MIVCGLFIHISITICQSVASHKYIQITGFTSNIFSWGAFEIKLMCPSCDMSRAIAHALWCLLSNDLNDTLLAGMLNDAPLSWFVHYNI